MAPRHALVVVALFAFGCAGAPRARGGDGRVRVRVAGATLAVDMGRPYGALTEEALEAWVRRAALMVAGYCGRFPVETLRVDVRTRPGGSLGWGQHWGGTRVMAMAGGRTSLRGLRRDWVLVHEMLHVAFPSLPRRQRWMREGLSTYLETVVRARSGVLSEEEVWERWARQMPLGLPRARDRGFNVTPSWRSLYWGGALYWLRVDVELRRATEGRVGLDAVIRELNARGANATQRWQPERLLRVCDEISGTAVMSELYDEMGDHRAEVDLAALFAELGVVTGDEGVSFDDRAPLAAIRRAMNAPGGPRLPPVPGDDGR